MKHKPVKLLPATEQPVDMPDGAVQFEVGIFGPHPVPLMLQCRPRSKQALRDMLFAMIDEYYARCQSSGLIMHGASPAIHIATKMPSEN